MRSFTRLDRIARPFVENALLGVSLVTGVGLLLRFYQIDQQSLWLDEISSLRNARAFGQGGLVALASVDQVAPLHSIVLWLATLAGGDGAFALRAPSALAGTLMIPATYALARRLSFDRTTAYLASLITCVSPLMIWYSQEARMYIFVALCATIYVTLAWPIVERKLTPTELVSLFAVAVAGLGFHHYMAFVILFFGLFLLLRGGIVQPRFWVWSITQFCAILVFSLWMVLTYKSIGGAAGTAKAHILFWIPYTIYAFLLGFSLGPSPREIATAGSSLSGYSPLDLAYVLLAGAAALVLLVRAALKDAAIVGRGWGSQPAARALLVWSWFLMPLLLAVGMTFVTKVQFNVRYTVISFPAFALILASGIRDLVTFLRRPAPAAATGLPAWSGATYLVTASAAVVMALLIVSDANYYYNDRYEKEDSRTLSDILRSDSVDAILVADNARVSKPLEYYKGPLLDSSLTIDYRWPSSTPDSVIESLRHKIGPNMSRVVFIKYRSWESDKGNVLKKKLDEIGMITKEISLPGVDVIEYSINRKAKPG